MLGSRHPDVIQVHQTRPVDIQNLARARAWSAFSHRYFWLLAVALTFGAFLGTRGLNEPDEGRYGEIAREMAASGNWLVPTLNGIPHFQKPPMHYWTTALSIRAFGANEWAVRLPSALAALGIILLTYQLGKRLFDEVAARHGALVLATTLGFFALARVATPDMLMCFWIVAAIASFIGRQPWLFFVCLGLGFATKGPMALVVPLAAAIPWEIASAGTGEQRRFPWCRGGLVTLAVSLGWFVTLALRDATLLDYFWRYEFIERFTSKVHGRSKPFWFYAPVLPAMLFPWIFLSWLPLRQGLAWFKARKFKPRHYLLAGWIALPLVVLSFSGSKLVTYVLPLLPACSLVLGLGFSRVNARLVPRVSGGLMLLWIALVAYAPFVEHRLGRQTTMRQLADLARATPDGAGAVYFTAGARVHGFEFYLGTEVLTTRPDADIVLPLDGDDAGRVFKNARAIEKKLRFGKPAMGVIERDLFGTVFKAPEWRIVGSSGDFHLISNSSIR
jgi:4-amino-4-deoxy-L-arabinose transferase-like glycosyltransferase